MTHIAIIGAGQAASSAAFKLRQLGHSGTITIIGEEPLPPYQRPPLSKGYLLGELERERLFLRPKASYAENGIELLLGDPVTSIDPQTNKITVGSNSIDYDQLIITTGSTPISLPAKIGGTLSNVFCVRTLKDIDAMEPEFVEGKRVLIVGGGYIGLEAAAVSSKKGLNVTVVEMSERILQRVASPETSEFFRNLHQKHGVDIKESVGLSELIASENAIQAHLSTGEVLDVDFVIVGIGIRPNIALAEAAGLDIDNGIKTDAFGQTSVTNIWAAGDCASFPFKSNRIRLESVPNAIDQAEVVAGNILGDKKEYIAKPWFWSDQYDVKLQIAGLNTGYDRVITRAGNAQSVSYWYYSNDTLLAVDAMNAPRDFMIGRRLIEAGKSPEKLAISDALTNLKSLL